MTLSEFRNGGEEKVLGGDPASGRISFDGCRFRVLNGGASGAALQVLMRKGDLVKAESDALVTKSEFVDLSSSMDGGLLRSVFRSQLANESVFFQTLRATKDDQDVLLAPQEPGDIVVLNVGEHNYNIIQGAFLASSSDIDLKTKAQWNLGKATFGAGLFVLKASGRGTVAVNSQGSMLKYTLRPNEKRSIDNGHLVAWTSGMKNEVGLATNSFFASFTSGEGFMCHFTGPGEVYVQTHKPQEERSSSSSSSSSQGRRRQGGTLPQCVGILIVIVIFLIFALIGSNFDPYDASFQMK